MIQKSFKSLEREMLLELNTFIHKENKLFEYHMQHINLVAKYSSILNTRLNARLDQRKLDYISLAHDLFKERSLHPEDFDKEWRGHIIYQDNNKYVRKNLDILEEYGLDEYFNSDMQYHALASGIFVRKEFNITDKEILYPIFFHSCPIISVYQELPHNIRTMVDVIMLADKLSSNYLRINFKHEPVRIDLDKAVFGESGNEFNYSLGLFISRLIAQGKSQELESMIATEYYFNRVYETLPIVSKNYSIKKLGGNQLWPERKSQALMMHYQYSGK